MRFLTFLFIPAFAIAGTANNQREWLGALVGSLIGLFFACGFCGLLPKRMVDWIFPEENEKPEPKEVDTNASHPTDKADDSDKA